MKTFFCALLAGAAFGISGTAIADDSSASLGMGGIELTHSADIRMAKEDLAISPKQVRIRFEFANDSGRDIDTMVAFPLPDIDASEFSESPLGTTVENPTNFVGFEVSEDGKKIPVQVEQRATYKGQDVTAIVKSVGLPVNVIVPNAYDHMKALTAAQRKVLISHDLADGDSGDDLHPHWVVETKFYWTQKFPAGKTVVLDERYQPVTGQSFFDPQTLADEKGGTGYYSKKYCFDRPTLASIGKELDIAKQAHRDDGALLLAFATDYVLVTGNNWKGPIGHFHLTLDKDAPDNVLSLCWDGDLKKTGPTTFEAVRDNFAPKQDIHMLVIEQRPPG
jgi:hypothetical protein